MGGEYGRGVWEENVGGCVRVWGGVGVGWEGMWEGSVHGRGVWEGSVGEKCRRVCKEKYGRERGSGYKWESVEEE